MSEFKVKTQGLKNTADQEEKLQNELQNIYDAVIGQRNSISFKISATGNIRQRLSNVSNGISREQRTLRKMHDNLSKAADLYEKTENKICRTAEDGRVSLLEKLEITNETGIKPSMDIDLVDIFKDSSLPANSLWKRTAEKLKKFEDDHKKKKTWKKGYYGQNGRFYDVDGADENSQRSKRYEELSSMEKAATIASIGGNVSLAAWGTKNQGSTGWASGSYEVSAAKLTAEGSAYAGIYSYDENGHKHFTPGFGAKIGIGFTAFSAEAKGQFGTDYWNAHGDVSVEAGKVGADAEVNVGLFDKNGKLNPQFAASASAEAILAEVGASAGITLAGTSIDAKGSINFGVGAHADVGFKDGRLHVDIGASLGIGVGIKLDIDMSGTINAVADTAKGVWNTFTGWFK